MSRKVVVALGGNALIRGDQTGTIKEQNENARRAARRILELARGDTLPVVTHGNGPQVGAILLRSEAGYDEYRIPKMPLDVCVADSQGGIGYMLERELRNAIAEDGASLDVATAVTQVEVDPEDEAFAEPTKPVGRHFIKEEADLLAKANDWIFKRDPRGRGWRRVVPSPYPLRAVNVASVNALIDAGFLVIAAGGGGVPVARGADGTLRGVEAVIDKDLASSKLASAIGAEILYIWTDIDRVYLNFGKPNERPIDKMTADDAERYLADGQFAKGSMGPKIRAGLEFVRAGGAKAVVASLDAKTEDDGTVILPT